MRTGAWGLWAFLLLGAGGCATQPPRPAPDATPRTQPAKPVTHLDEPDRAAPARTGAREALVAFLDAAAREDFEACYRLLAAPLRERYTPARLAQDFAATKTPAQEKLARVRAALGPDLPEVDAQAELSLGSQRAVRLVKERDGWRVAALE